MPSRRLRGAVGRGTAVKKVLRCGDVVPGCAEEVHADDEAEILRQAAEHAREAHGLKEIDKATLERVRAAIRTER